MAQACRNIASPSSRRGAHCRAAPAAIVRRWLPAAGCCARLGAHGLLYQAVIAPLSVAITHTYLDETLATILTSLSGTRGDFLNLLECEHFAAVVISRQAFALPSALSQLSKQRNPRGNAEEFALREAADSVILEALAESPERVASAFAKVLEHCRASGHHSPEEIDAAASQLSRELGIA